MGLLACPLPAQILPLSAVSLLNSQWDRERLGSATRLLSPREVWGPLLASFPDETEDTNHFPGHWDSWWPTAQTAWLGGDGN
jgi:hypothetical protein